MACPMDGAVGKLTARPIPCVATGQILHQKKVKPKFQNREGFRFHDNPIPACRQFRLRGVSPAGVLTLPAVRLRHHRGYGRHAAMLLRAHLCGDRRNRCGRNATCRLQRPHQMTCWSALGCFRNAHVAPSSRATRGTDARTAANARALAIRSASGSTTVSQRWRCT